MLKNLSEVLKGLKINESVAKNIQKLSNAILNLKSNLNNVSPSSTEFLNSIKELVSQGEALKNLATVLKATKTQLEEAKKAVSDTSGSSGSSGTKQKAKEVSDILNAYKELEKSEIRYQELRAKVNLGIATDSEIDKFNTLTAKREEYNKVLEQTTVLTKEETNARNQYQNAVKKGNTSYGSIVGANRVTDVNKAYEEATRINDLMRQTEQLMNKAFQPNVKGFEDIFNRAKTQVDELNKKLQQGKISNIQTGYTDQINKIISDLNKVVAVSTPGYANIEQAQQAMLSYAQTLNNGNVQIGNFNNQNKTLTASFERQRGVIQEVALTWNEVTGAITMVNKGTKQAQSVMASFTQGLKARFKSLIQYLTIFVSYYRIIAMFRKGIGYIRELNTALTDMKKVSDQSISSLKNFQKESFNIANSVATTATQIQKSVVDWMRLGESFEEAAKSAKAATTLLNVSNFENIDEVTKSLVSMSAAYKDLTKTDIVDKISYVGNHYSIATDELAVALQASASALQTAGNDMNEAVAIITAGNAVVQDAAKVGNGIQTIALRLVGTKEAKEQLEELGEDTDGVITTISKLRDTILSATKVASNDFSGFDILDDNGNYKSTYDIMLGLSDIYEEIVETDKKFGNNNLNLLLETIAGKRRANIAASILQNEDLLTSVYDSSTNESEGSAQKALDKHLDSIEGKIQQFTNKVQEFWYGFIDSETVKGFIDLGTSVLDILGKITSSLGEVGTIIAALGTSLAFHFAKVKSGGRVKKFTLVAKNMPPNRLAERCASSGVYRNDNICSL